MSKRPGTRRSKVDRVKLRQAAQRIQTRRVRLALSPERYGDLIGVSGMTVRRAEAGLPLTLESQGRFARDLTVDVDDLFGLPLSSGRPAPSLWNVAA